MSPGPRKAGRRECAVRSPPQAAGICAGRIHFARAFQIRGAPMEPWLHGEHNAAMIGCQGYYEYLAGHVAGPDLNGYATRDISLG